MPEISIERLTELESLEKKYSSIHQKGKCIVCTCSLTSHIDEGTGWRCHSLGADLSQCECFLRKREPKDELDYYDIRKRCDEALGSFG